MLLVSANVHPYKSINETQHVALDGKVTVLVGMNEAGKTVFLQALQKSHDALGIAKFDPTPDYPRKDYIAYAKQHKTLPAKVTELFYKLDADEIAELNQAHHVTLPHDFGFSVSTDYANKRTISIDVDDAPAIAWLSQSVKWSTDALAALKKASSIREAPTHLKATNLTDSDKEHLGTLETRIAATTWDSVVESEVWQWINARMPKFLYFSDYDLLPSKMNIAELGAAFESAKADAKQLSTKHRAMLALLRMADITIEDMLKTGGYESLKAKIEGVSISLTDQIMEFWKQNEDLEVEVDIKADPDDKPPYNNGPNIYLRIKNKRHRGVSTPFEQRSRGFIWFFSFLVWFDSVQNQIDVTGKTGPRNLVLLLDEPGLALHAKAQEDFLRYIDELADKHQVIYTTHSPFMVHSDRLQQVRVVEDKTSIGTVISTNVSASDPRTVFPLQAALGWTIAQNLFISKRNLLVEGPSELIYLKAVSSILEGLGREHLADTITIVPVGGLDKLVTFIALLGASGLKLAVIHDFKGSPEQALAKLAQAKIIPQKSILNASQFRDLGNIGKDGVPTDTEDLFDLDLYLGMFAKAYAKELNGNAVTKTKLPAGDRVVDRIDRYLADNSIRIRKSGGFNHYVVASHFASNPPSKLDEETLNRFEAMFAAINKLLA